MSARSSAFLIGAVALSACASVLGLPDEYSGGVDQSHADASSEAQASDSEVPDADAGVDGDAASPDGSDATDAIGPDAEAGMDAEAGADGDASMPDAPAILGLGAGIEHACAIVYTTDSTRELRCWGSCENDRLGAACTTGVTLTPVPIFTDTLQHRINDAVAVAGTFTSTCAVLATGAVVCWGDCQYGQLGNPTACPDTDASTNSRSELPVQVLDQSSSALANIRAVAGYGYHYCALSHTNQVSCWGAYEWENQLDPSAWHPRAALQPELPDAGLGPLAVGSRHACVVSSGEVRCWGNNHGGQLGDQGDGSAGPVKIQLVGSATDVSRGDEHSCATVGQDRSVECWGSWEGTSPTPTPSGVQTDGGVLKNIVLLAGAYHFTCGLDPSGHVICWGQHPERWAGKYWSGSIEEYEPPFMIETEPNVPLAGMKYLAGGANFACAASDHDVYCWGDLSYQAGSDSCDPGGGPASDCAVYARRVDGLP